MITRKELGWMAAVLGALAIGAFLGRAYQQRVERAERSVRLAVANAQLERLHAENRRLAAELAARPSSAAVTESKTAPGVLTGPNAPAPERLRILADLQSRKLASTNVRFLDREGKLTPAFVELYALTPAEQGALQQAIDQSKERIAELERENATVTRDPNGAIVISVKPFPEAGGAAYDQLVKSFAATLGAERNAAFLAMGVQQVERALSHFGAAQRTLTVSPVGATGYRVHEAHQLAQESGTSTSEFMNFATMAQHLGTLERLLPPEFRAGR